MSQPVLLAVVIVTALAFDFTNGFHDTANAVAPAIATGALRPRIAVLLSAVLNVVGAFLSLAVAATIAKGIVDQSKITLTIIFAGLIGAITWNLLTWYFGIPSSSSHALIGGIVGAMVAGAGWAYVNTQGIVQKVVIPALVSPIVAGLAAAAGTWAVVRLVRRRKGSAIRRGFAGGQTVTTSLLSLAHGTNDAQKTMGVITLALVADGALKKGAATPTWVVLTAGLAIGLGTYFGGWRIIKTLGQGLSDLWPSQGIASQVSAATVILASSHVGYPLSTTQVVSGSIVGSGLGHHAATVRWPMAGRIAVAWVLTLPSAGLVGAAAYALAHLIGGTAGVVTIGLLAAAGAAALWWRSRRSRVDADSVIPELPHFEHDTEMVSGRVA